MTRQEEWLVTLAVLLLVTLLPAIYLAIICRVIDK